MIWIVSVSYVLMAGLLIATWRYRKFLARSSTTERSSTPKAAIFVPVQRLTPGDVEALEVLFEQDYPDYEVLFGVLTRRDAAYERLIALCERYRGRARVVASGPSTTCSDKIQNLLACYDACHHETEVLVLMDSDLAPDPSLLRRLVRPLDNPGVGAVTAHRWIGAGDGSLAGVLAAMANAAGLVSVWLFARVCGGVIAIRKDTFEWLDVPTLWSRTASEDITICSLLVGRGLRIVHAERGIVMSRQCQDARSYWSHVVSQLVMARVYAPALWWQLLGFYVCTVSVVIYGLAGVVESFTGRAPSGAELAAALLPIAFCVQGWVLIGGAQRMLVQRGETPRVIPASYLPLYVFVMLIGVLQILTSATSNSVVVDGVRYRLDARDRTTVSRLPFSAAEGPSAYAGASRERSLGPPRSWRRCRRGGSVPS
jgi:hypothetical protein